MTVLKLAGEDLINQAVAYGNLGMSTKPAASWIRRLNIGKNLLPYFNRLAQKIESIEFNRR